MIDGVLNEWNNIKSRIDKIEEQQKRFIKYFGIQNELCIEKILTMNNIVYSYFDKMVETYNLNANQIKELIYIICYWELKTDAILSEYKFYLLVHYYYIANHNEFKNEEFLKWNYDKEQFSKKHKYRIEFCFSTDDYYCFCDAFLGYLRSKYFIYIENKYKQLCQTTKY